MNFLPKNRQKRNQLFLTLAVVVLAIAGIGFGVIHPQYTNLAAIRKQTAETQVKWKDNSRLIQDSTANDGELADLSQDLASNELDMATGDIYAWTLDTIRHFKAAYKVDVPEIGQPTISAMDVFPSFPYQQMRFTIHGSGYYHDIGKFIADFENEYPHMRVENIDMNPVSGDTEKLYFKAEVVALVKTTP
jgi:hypothetical protein